MSLLHVVGHDHDRHLFCELEHRLFDNASRGRVESRTRLVHEQHSRAHRERARDAQSLLLAAGESAARLAQAVTNFFPQPGLGETRLNKPILLVTARVDAGELESGDDVVVDRHSRKRIRLLEHHPYISASLREPATRAVDVVAVKQYLTGQRRGRHHFVHAVQDAKEGGFSTARRADQGSDQSRLHRKIHTVEHLAIAEPCRD